MLPALAIVAQSPSRLQVMSYSMCYVTAKPIPACVGCLRQTWSEWPTVILKSPWGKTTSRKFSQTLTTRWHTHSAQSAAATSFKNHPTPNSVVSCQSRSRSRTTKMRPARSSYRSQCSLLGVPTMKTVYLNIMTCCPSSLSFLLGLVLIVTARHTPNNWREYVYLYWHSTSTKKLILALNGHRFGAEVEIKSWWSRGGWWGLVWKEIGGSITIWLLSVQVITLNPRI